MATGQQLFNKATTIMDEIASTGIPDPSTTALYAIKAVNIIDMLQKELMPISELYKTIDIVQSGTSGYVEVTLPSDYATLYQLLDNDLNIFIDFKTVGSSLYVPFDFNGKLVYRPIPTTITSLTQELEIEDLLATDTIPYGLASQLYLGENQEVSRWCENKYDEAKRSATKPKKSQVHQIEDVYGGI